MDFYQIRQVVNRQKNVEVYPDFKVTKSSDLMVRGRDFYAIWDEKNNIWSTDEYDVQRIVDADLWKMTEDIGTSVVGAEVIPKPMSSFNSGSWTKFQSYIKSLSDNYMSLNNNIVFANQETKKEDYASVRLPYSLADPINEGSAFLRLLDRLYGPDESQKIIWAIGSIFAGESKTIQKFLVLYGTIGSGKSTILNIIEKLFAGYTTSFVAEDLAAANKQFATEVFKDNHLVGIQYDGDLSKIESNALLNSITAHEPMTINEKHKSQYTTCIDAMLFMGTNKPVKITDAKSGIIRRLIDVTPTGETFPVDEYERLMAAIPFELGGIAGYCIKVFNQMGRNYYKEYIPIQMISKTNVFYNFVDSHFEIFLEDGVTLNHAFDLFKKWREESDIEYSMPKYRFRDELKEYFDSFEDRAYVGEHRVRSYYSGFKSDKFLVVETKSLGSSKSLQLECTRDILTEILGGEKAQYANANGTPTSKWDNVQTTLRDIDTSKLHYVQPPINHIVIDFDLKDNTGEKSKDMNLAAAALWPETYAEYSKSGAGVHLHYIYSGDPFELSAVYSKDIEIKVFVGNSALRRIQSFNNGISVAIINEGLPKKEKKRGEKVDYGPITEEHLANMIVRNLNKEVHSATRPSIDFIHKLLEDAYNSGISYDVSNLRTNVIAFANNSSNQAAYCMKRVASMRFSSDGAIQSTVGKVVSTETPESPIAVFDIEVYPNLFMLSWGLLNDGDITTLVNPTPGQVAILFEKFRMIGFNNRKYDNHLCYARIHGYDNVELYHLSKKIINDSAGYFGAAYGLAYGDIYDMSSQKQSLKKFMVDYKINHIELDIPWDKPVEDHLIPIITEYCENDVRATIEVIRRRNHDYVARHILASISGLPVSASTAAHTELIIFGHRGDHYHDFQWRDLADEFAGYSFDSGISSYMGEDPSEGGYVYAKPGVWDNVTVFDIESMHPSTIIALEYFGPEATARYKELVDLRLAIKHRDLAAAREMLDGKAAEYLTDNDSAQALSYALKIVINIVYGLTSAKFKNPFYDPKNVDNIIAKRGALFMIWLRNTLDGKLPEGCEIIHIKTDSIKIANTTPIKIANITPEVASFVIESGKDFGYKFVIEDTYKQMALVNKAVYIADKDHGKYEAVGAQFQHPVVYKALFSGEPLVYDDLCETRGVKTSMILRDPAGISEDIYVGKVGRFIPTMDGRQLLRKNNKDGYDSVTKTKPHLWALADTSSLMNGRSNIDHSFYINLVEGAIKVLDELETNKSFNYIPFEVDYLIRDINNAAKNGEGDG